MRTPRASVARNGREITIARCVEMAPIPVKRVVSVSSEDGLNPASNLLRRGGGRKWLTRREDKCRRAEVVLELCKKTRINSVEIGNFGSAFIELHVSSGAAASSSDSLGDCEWMTLLPSCMLMTVQDSRAGRNTTSPLVCERERFSATAVSLKWSHVKLICRQPYNMSSQFGLQYVNFYSEHATICSPVTPHSTPSPIHKYHHHHPSPSHPPHTPGSTPHRTPKYKLPALPSATPCKPGDPISKPPGLKSKTPRRPLRESNDDEREEFSGVEKQSRLLSNALKAPAGSTQMNPILEQIISEREKMKQEKSFGSSYEKKQLLVKELSKATGKSDFYAGYEKSTGKSVEMSLAFRKIASHDNDYEIGEEPEFGGWGWRGGGKRRRRGRGGREDGWVTKRKKKLSGMISECRRVLSEAGTAGGTSGRPEDLSSTSISDDTAPIKPDQSTDSPVVATSTECASDSDSDATVIVDFPDEDPSPPSPQCPLSPLATLKQGTSEDNVPHPPNDVVVLTHVQCPLCDQPFPSYAIELHAASCGNTGNTGSLPVYID